MPQIPQFKGPNEVLRGSKIFFRSLAALNRAAATSLNKDKAVRAHRAWEKSHVARGRKSGLAS